MTSDRPSFRQFRQRLSNKDHLMGTFVKTPTTHATEMLGMMGFDFVVFDQEHSPLDLGALDMMILAARASNIAGIVRVPSADPSGILHVLDAGATGVLVPHVYTAETARQIVAACRYKGGKRGFANTTRAGDFGGVGGKAHKENQDNEVACVAMIEDVEALDNIDEIVATPGLDAIFIGRGDLTAALDAPGMDSEETMAIARPVMEAANKVGLPIIMLCTGRPDAENMAALGATAFMSGSDHGFMRAGAKNALDVLKAPL